MLVTAKTLSLIEQKRLQWAREREEMVGLYGLWGRPRLLDKKEKAFLCNKNNLLPPIEGKSEYEEQIKAEESETSGYLSDSPKHLKEKEPNQENHCAKEPNEPLNNEAVHKEQQSWNEVSNADQENYWMQKKMYKNYKNQNWAHQNTDSYNAQRFYQTNRNFWYGTPESLSSDDGTRLRWGDRGVGIGHLWEPVINHPDCRLPLVSDPYRQTPKWVEKGLKNADGNKADILIIHHPDDDQYDPLVRGDNSFAPQKNYLLGQNAPIPQEVIEERERKRKKALEHQNAIKKQLEEREMKRKQERENRIREEKMEEERIRKEQEIERLRYEDEQKKIKQKEEIEKKKEEVMREAIEVAEKRAREEKRLSKKHLINDINQKNYLTSENKLERIIERPEKNNCYRKQNNKTPKHKKIEESSAVDTPNESKKTQCEKTLKDSSSQFEEIALAQNFQLLNVNGLPVDGGLALMLDTPPKDNFFIPSDGVQLALLMSPRNATSGDRHPTNSGLVSHSVSTGERVLTPSKYRISERSHFTPAHKSTQTDANYSYWIKNIESAVRGKKPNRRFGTNSGSSGGSQKCSNERPHKHIRCFLSSKHRSKPLSSKLSLEDRPKWGINRPSVQYKKQSEKDPYYQKKIKERLRKAEPEIPSMGNIENTEDDKEKEMSAVVRLLDCQTDEEDKPPKEEILIQNGYRMNSNLSSPVFVPIGSRLSKWEKLKKLELDSERSRSNDSEQFELGVNEDEEDGENAAVPGSVGFLTQSQLDAVKQIASLREGLKKLQKDYSTSRSLTPFSDKSLEK